MIQTVRPVLFVVLPETLLLDLAGMADALRVANKIGDTPYFAARYVGPRASARTSIGLSVAPLEALPESIPAGAWVVLPGMSNSAVGLETPAVREVIHWLVRAVGPEQRLCCICSGALVAAAAGFLDDRLCTTHHELCERLQSRHPRARVIDNR